MFRQKQTHTANLLRHRLLIFIGLLWLGMIVGIFFVATPLKFQVPSVTLGIGLEALKILTLAVFGLQNIYQATFPGTKV